MIFTTIITIFAGEIVVNMKQVEWRPVVGYEGLYEVSDMGEVKSLARTCKTRGGGDKPVHERILIPCVIRGYKNVVLCRGGNEHKHKLVHRLVAEAFLPNPDGKPVVEHLDCNSLNNSVENLRWSTQKENCNNPISRSRNSSRKIGEANGQYGRRNEQIANSRRVACFTKDGDFVAVYPSVAEAERETGIRSSGIIACALGTKKLDKRDGRYYTKKSAGGYIWRYI